MKKLALTIAMTAMASFAGTWTGTITDAMCGAKHADASEKSMACSKRCVERGSAPVFISGDKVIKIANPEAVKELIGQKVSIDGELAGDTVTIAKVTPESK
jgi:hypothetical protein